MVFIEELSDYSNDVDPYNQAKEQLLLYIEKTYDVESEEANKLYKIMLEEKNVKDPTIRFVEREDGLDKKETSQTLLKYIERFKNDNEVMVPSLTCYDRKDRSFQGEFIQDGLSLRTKKKKEAAVCEAKGDKIGFLINNLLQKAFKLRNNSLSGAYLSLSTIFYNPSSHTALTSGTRIAASMGNMVTESMVAGRRLYRDPESVVNHFLAILTEVDLDRIKTTNKKYGISSPSVEDVMGMVKHSTSDSWSNEKYMNNIREFVSKLNGHERSAILYTYDMYHLEQVNPKFTRGMLDKLSRQCVSISDDISILKEYDEFIVNIAHHICFNHIRGLGKNYEEYSSEIRDRLVSTTINLARELEKYKDYIDTYLKAKTMPTNIAFIREMVMEAISHSDTDSTCGWYGHRVEERFGRYDTTHKGIGYFSAYMMFNSGVVSHLLRQLTTNFNVPMEHRDKLTMKNEFFFPVFGSANVTKHYISNIMIKEGLVYEEPKLEIKGNSLIASNNSDFIRDDFTNLVKHITDRITTGEQLDVEEVIGKVVAIENEIIDKFKRSDPSIFKLDKINNTYKLMKDDASKWTSTNIYHSELYNHVFEEKYGKAQDLPYIGVSIPLLSIKLLDMVEEIKDEDVKSKLKTFLEKHPKNKLERLIYPLSIIRSKGIPDEIKHMVDIHKLILLSLNGHYTLLEVLGIYVKEDTLLTEQGY